MAKKKKIDWSKVPWTEFLPCELPTDDVNQLDPPTAILRNSRYQVRDLPAAGAAGLHGGLRADGAPVVQGA